MYGTTSYDTEENFTGLEEIGNYTRTARAEVEKEPRIHMQHGRATMTAEQRRLERSLFKVASKNS